MNLKELNCQNQSEYNEELTHQEKMKFKDQLHPNWNFSSDEKKLLRTFKFKNFKLSLELVTKVAEVSEIQKHHPDIHFGWGYCQIEITNHQKNNLTLNDFILAIKIDEITHGIN